MTEPAERIEPPTDHGEDEAVEDGICIVVCGNPVDGCGYFGPFIDGEVAEQWAETELRDEEWWVAPLVAVYEEEVAH